ncbi:type IV pilus assembly protein PilB [Candidatus Electrothrix marina]|uniref:Type IV pilus assembly protein PilB n=1 Tax=Candidatus Electrothrix marina TaxID=1859130 RepID=A0A444JD87_9BACT|nr:type IV pilus assembly protein PilB [Candidatus Electrothrix marina]
MAKKTADSKAPQKASLKRTVKDQSGAGKLKIGELLQKAGYITAAEFNNAKAINKKSGERLGKILVENGTIESDTIPNFLSRQHNYTLVNIAEEVPSQDALQLVPYEIAKKYLAFPLRIAGDTLQITMAEPTDALEVEELQNAVKKGLDVCVSTAKDIIDAYKTYYKIDEEEYKSFFAEDDEQDVQVEQVEDWGALVSDVADEFEFEDGSDEDEGIAGQFSANDAPIIKLVNGILIKAVQDGVSDIHIEPFEKTMQVRYRKDGSLFKSMNLPLTIKNALIARLKILADLNITERRIPQDGRISIRLGRNKAVDFRVSTLPLLHGEGTVLRILDKGSLNVDLTKLGFEVETFETLKRCLASPQGLLLVTGPTGSGKTVTLYSALNSLNSEDIKILTAEDPVEFNFKGINQVNVNVEVGMTFPAALKAFLRQDPDIIMVGEIRDISTAEIAMKAAMTGHLVFSTLHTNDAVATVSRMVDIGIPPYILAGSLTMVLAQRLGRRLCAKCKQPATYERKHLITIGFTEEQIDTEGFQLYEAKGCAVCNGLGYKGRVGFFELLEVTDEVAQAIQAQVSEEQLRKVAMQSGMHTLRQAALIKAKQGITSLDEVLRRTVAHEDTLPAYLVNPDVEEYEDGDVIIQEGNEDDRNFYQLIRGKVGVLKQGKKIAEITEPGEYFGEMACLMNEARYATVVSLGRCKIKRYPGDKLTELIEKYPEISMKLFKTMAKRLRKTDNIVIQLAGGKRTQKPTIPPRMR